MYFKFDLNLLIIVMEWPAANIERVGFSNLYCVVLFSKLTILEPFHIERYILLSKPIIKKKQGVKCKFGLVFWAKNYEVSWIKSIKNI